MKQMMPKRILGIATAAVLVAISFASLTSAEEEPALPIPIMVPIDGQGSVPVAVYFADNMAFGPQWRVGNLIRIETAVVNLDPDWDTDFADTIFVGDLPVDLAQSVSGLMMTDPETGLLVPKVYTQSEIMADPMVLYDTYMVSVSEITITIYLTTDAENYCWSWISDFTNGVQDTDTVTREINKGGHLIYGFLWDTTEAVPGIYRVDVSIPGLWKINHAIETEYPVTTEEVTVTEEDVVVEPTGFETVPSDNGGVDSETNTAWIQIGDLVAKSDSGSTGGGDNGDHDGGGDGGDGNMNGGGGELNGGNGNGQLGSLMSRYLR